MAGLKSSLAIRAQYTKNEWSAKVARGLFLVAVSVFFMTAKYHVQNLWIDKFVPSQFRIGRSLPVRHIRSIRNT